MGPGWYADALIPFTDPATGKAPVGAALTAVPFDVKSGNNQPVWVDLQVPRTATQAPIPRHLYGDQQAGHDHWRGFADRLEL